MSKPIEDDLILINKEEKKPKLVEKKLILNKKIAKEGYSIEIIDSYPSSKDMPFETYLLNYIILNEDEQAPKAHLKYNEDEQNIILNVQSKNFFNIPKGIHVDWKLMRKFNLVLKFQSGDLICNCKDTGNHTIYGYDGYTYYLLSEPTMIFEGLDKKRYLGTNDLKLNKDDLTHYYSIKREVKTNITDGYIPHTEYKMKDIPTRDIHGDLVTLTDGTIKYKQEFLPVIRKNLHQMKITYEIQETIFVRSLDTKDYLEQLKKEKGKDYNKYIILKKRYQGNVEEVIKNKYGVIINMLKDEENKLVEIEIIIKLPEKEQYNIMKKILDNTKLEEIILDYEKSDEMKVDKNLRGESQPEEVPLAFRRLIAEALPENGTSTERVLNEEVTLIPQPVDEKQENTNRMEEEKPVDLDNFNILDFLN